MPLPLPPLSWGAWCPGETPVVVPWLEQLGDKGNNLKLRFITTGIELLPLVVPCDVGRNLHWQAKQKGRGRGLGPAVDENLLLETLAVGEFLRTDEATLVFDCRSMRDPNDAVGALLRQHTGCHPLNLERLLQDDNFDRWLVSVSKWLGRTLEEAATRPIRHTGDRVPVNIVLYCKKGRHRSVAACLILVHLLEASRRTPGVDSIEHTTRGFWNRFCDGLDCRECCGPSITRDRVLAVARERWRQLLQAG